MVVLASSFDFEHLNVGVILIKSNNSASCSFSGNPLSRPTTIIKCTVNIFTFDQTKLADAFVPNHLFLLIEFIFLSTSLVEGFNYCIFFFIEKVVIQRLDLPFRIEEIICWNLISPKTLVFYNISFFLDIQAIYHLPFQVLFFLPDLYFNVLNFLNFVSDAFLLRKEFHEHLIIKNFLNFFAVRFFLKLQDLFKLIHCLFKLSTWSAQNDLSIF